jgi:Bacteriocin-protection, YdeI or OmpD-Associated/Domain of unknown function (DUF1905)
MQYTIEKSVSGIHFITIEDKVAKGFIKKGSKRVVCILNKELKLHVALLTKKEGGYYIIIGSSALKKLKVRKGIVVTADFKADISTYQFDMPEELQEVLDTDSKANTIFHTLTAGNQRGLIYLVNSVKSSEKKIGRALKIAEKIKTGISSPREILN